MSRLQRFARTALLASATCFGLPAAAHAGMADTPGKGFIILDVSRQYARANHSLDKDGKLGNLNDDIVMYDPAGNPLGTIKVPAQHNEKVLLTQLFYGFTDKFAGGVIVPYFLESETKLNFHWTPGAYANDLGRPYSDSDFWEFAGSMGQKKPSDYKKKNILGDVVLGGIYSLQKTKRYQTAVLGFVNTRTGKLSDPEILGATGTNGFELQSNGDIGLHALGDYFLNPRISVGGEVFYEWYFPRRFHNAMGKNNPLLSYEGLYAGPDYLVIPGDWIGGSTSAQFNIIRGTNEPSWITRKNPAMQKTLPNFFTVSPGIKYIRFFGNRYRSDSDFLDRKRELAHPNGYRVNSQVKTAVNFLRYGAPVSVYYILMSQELIHGRSFFPVVNNTFGIQLYAAF
jgi:hypothetical protein